jgi:hypothetical protein
LNNASEVSTTSIIRADAKPVAFKKLAENRANDGISGAVGKKLEIMHLLCLALFFADKLLRLLFYHEDGRSIVLRNIGELLSGYTALQARIYFS